MYDVKSVAEFAAVQENLTVNKPGCINLSVLRG